MPGQPPPGFGKFVDPHCPGHGPMRRATRVDAVEGFVQLESTAWTCDRCDKRLAVVTTVPHHARAAG